jgi:predicted nucleic acid-binding protein
MHRIIIADASCLIVLDKIGELDLLHKLFGIITITNEVIAEYGKQLPSWLDIKQPLDRKYQFLIETFLDIGEASAIALALEYNNSLLILDDLKARKFAERLNINITGTLGIIADAKLAGIIPSVRPLLEKIKQTNFRITEAIELALLKKAGE